MRHWHSTPFEMCEIKYHINVYQFLLLVNGLDIELQMLMNILPRYSILDKEFYLPITKKS